MTRHLLQSCKERASAIWLEFCDHLSKFSIEEVTYRDSSELGRAWRPEDSWNARIDSVFRPGVVGEYIYDFGSSTELKFTI